MSVYEPQDYEKVIERIKTKISQLNIEMGKCLTEEEILILHISFNHISISFVILPKPKFLKQKRL